MRTPQSDLLTSEPVGVEADPVDVGVLGGDFPPKSHEPPCTSISSSSTRGIALAGIFAHEFPIKLVRKVEEE